MPPRSSRVARGGVYGVNFCPFTLIISPTLESSMPERIVEQYADVLQNIEAAIVSVHRRNPSLLDYDVEGALEALIADYSAEQRGRMAAQRELADGRGDVYQAVRAVCEWRLGRETMAGAPPGGAGRTTVEEIVACLKRLQKSVRRWNKEGGRQGYLRFIGRYIP